MSAVTLKQSVLAGLLAVAPMASAVAQQAAAPPDFSSNLAGWVGLNGGGPFYEPVPGRLPPVVSDPAHPFIPNGVDQQPTFRIADLSNPNLKPWVKERMKKDIDEMLAGKKSAFTAQSSCVPAGVPFFMGYGGPDPLVFLQTPKEVWIMWTRGQSIPAHLHGRAPLGEPEAVLVRRIGRPLRRRHARRRHHRPERQDGRRHLPHAAHREAARRRALANGRRRQGDGGRSSRSMTPTLSTSPGPECGAIGAWSRSRTKKSAPRTTPISSTITSRRRRSRISESTVSEVRIIISINQPSS